MSSIRVGIAQVPQTADIGENLATALDYMERAAREGVELLCFPETHLAGYRVGVMAVEASCETEELERASARVAAECRRLSLGVILGTETPNHDGKPYNSAVIFDQDGDILALHHKSRLTPKDALGYAAGGDSTLFEVKGIRMGVVICFEGFRFAETTRALVEAGARIVFHPQFNHVLPGMEWKLPVHEALLVTRAAENGVYFVSANMSHPLNNCRSLIVAPNGLIDAASVLGEEMLVVGDLDPDLATRAFIDGDPETLMTALGER